MRKFTSGRLAGALVAALTMLVLASFSSSASAVPYCGIPVPAKSTCANNTGGHLINGNEARYTGAGSISVCQKVTRGGTVYNRYCATDYAFMTGAIEYGYYIGWVGNDSPWQHTINGNYSALDVAGRSASSLSYAEPSAAPPATARADFGVLRSGMSGKVNTIARPNDQVSLKTTSDKLCLESSQAGGGACQTYDKLDETGVLGAGICSPRLPADRVGIYGVVADGATSVKAVAAGGETLGSTPVSSNTFALSLSKTDAANTDHFESVGSDGAVSLGNVLPDDLSC